MKKTSTNIDRLLLLVLTSLALGACAFTDYGNRINQEQLSIARLEEKRHSLETQYVIVMNSLEIHPAEDVLIKERDEVRRKLLDLSYEINEKRKGLNQSLLEWEQKIVQERIEREMVDREVKENEFKDEQVEFENK
jgi:hypothetical protein